MILALARLLAMADSTANGGENGSMQPTQTPPPLDDQQSQDAAGTRYSEEPQSMPIEGTRALASQTEGSDQRKDMCADPCASKEKGKRVAA